MSVIVLYKLNFTYRKKRQKDATLFIPYTRIQNLQHVFFVDNFLVAQTSLMITMETGWTFDNVYGNTIDFRFTFLLTRDVMLWKLR